MATSYDTAVMVRRPKRTHRTLGESESHFFFYSCFASLACFASARLLMSFCNECTYARTIFGGASLIAAPTNAWVQYGVIVPGASFASTERTKAFGFGMNNDGRRILDMAEVYGDAFF